ncbi:DUF7674 family protein [Goodfellowiella coeruleoviolacea]|uniref:DUF7674 domain-containing protein n=1 Tax=Goodfellowiella coeruleoviolacea TaxID=334858 RepID=A0AAE3KIA5_9PSEU|nr:hypothetical protein [Goodfellowiella coeruleoviolacea]MCP2169071.1 hypothetical protein [Goodfellowiella coeruleoviolacea]
MTEWRGKALAQFPELRELVERESWSCHVFLFELRHLAMEAHRTADTEALTRVYDFARWCLEQPGQFLSNAAVVSFYVHVFDDWELRHEVVRWVPARIAERVRPLWEWRLSSERLAEVDRLLAAPTPPECTPPGGVG